jgi:hypothetical protein
VNSYFFVLVPSATCVPRTWTHFPRYQKLTPYTCPVFAVGCLEPCYGSKPCFVQKKKLYLALFVSEMWMLLEEQQDSCKGKEAEN